MARPKYEKWLTPEGLLRLKGWAMLGLTDEQIAKNMGIRCSTLYVWKNNHPEISEALKEGKEPADFAVMNALYENALAGNVTAQMYWLNNRMPDRFRAKVEHNVEGTVSITFTGEDRLED
jgi:hypothetical protein